MTEQQYIDAVNVARLRLAIYALGEMNVDATDEVRADFVKARDLLYHVEDVLTGRIVLTSPPPTAPSESK